MTFPLTFYSILKFLESVIWRPNSSRPSDLASQVLTQQSGAAFWCGHSPLRCVCCPATGRPGGEGEVFCLRPAGSRLDGSSGRPHLLQTSEQAGLTKSAFTGRFHVPFNEETAGLAAGYKRRAYWNTQIWISCMRRQVGAEASLSLRDISERHWSSDVLRVWCFRDAG